jgi:hypothetical protein
LLARLDPDAQLYGEQIYQCYGFTDAFNPNWRDAKLWVNQDVIGINLRNYAAEQSKIY